MACTFTWPWATVDPEVDPEAPTRDNLCSLKLENHFQLGVDGTIDETRIVLQLEDWEVHEGLQEPPLECADLPLLYSWSAGELMLIKQ